MKKIIRKISGLIFVLAIITVWAYYSYDDKSYVANANTMPENIVSNITVSQNLNLSNQKIEWGIKRNDNHMQPDLGAKNLELMKEYDGMAMGNAEKKYVYLTFDNGYEAGYTGKILDTLKENNVKATFFITAHYSNTAGDMIQRMIDEGHIVREPHGKSCYDARNGRNSTKRRYNEITYCYI